MVSTRQPFGRCPEPPTHMENHSWSCLTLCHVTVLQRGCLNWHIAGSKLIKSSISPQLHQPLFEYEHNHDVGGAFWSSQTNPDTRSTWISNINIAALPEQFSSYVASKNKGFLQTDKSNIKNYRYVQVHAYRHHRRNPVWFIRSKGKNKT